MHSLEIERIAVNLIHTHLPNAGWKFVWNNRVKTLGQCSYRKKEIRLSYRWMIALSDEQVLDTILHEIAHALTPDNGHGAEWKQACIRVGANPLRLYDGEVKVTDVATPTHKLIDTTTGKVLKNYYRAPNEKMRKKISTYYVRGRKEETIGKLVIEETSLLDLI